jgi:hypothetical protein
MSDGWYRFPLALLAYKPDSPEATLDAILYYTLWTVGDSSAAKEIEDDDAYAYGRANRAVFKKCWYHLQLVRGAKILGVQGIHCEDGYKKIQVITEYLWPESSATKNKLSISSEFFWRAWSTVQEDGRKEELRWRDLRFLSALLSKIGSRKFDRCGWQEIQARAAGWCGKLDMANATVDERARRAPLILTQDQIRTTRDELEANKFFCRIKYRTGGKGNGGESWYSFSTSNREELLSWIAGKKLGMKAALEVKRAEDAALLAKIRTQPEVIPNSPRTLIGGGRISECPISAGSATIIRSWDIKPKNRRIDFGQN